MLLEVSDEGLEYLKELASISDPTDEDDILVEAGLKPSNSKTEQQAQDEMVLSIYSTLGRTNRRRVLDENYITDLLDDDAPYKREIQRSIARLYEAEFLVNQDKDEGVII